MIILLSLILFLIERNFYNDYLIIIEFFLLILLIVLFIIYNLILIYKRLKLHRIKEILN